MGSMAVAGEVEAAALTPLRVFFIPFFATGHMIPMVDIARLFASRGIDSTILVTPANAALIRRTVDCAVTAGLPIRTLVYPFPSAESNLPPGIENISSLPPSDSYKIDVATPFTLPSHERLLRLHRPNAIISDTHFPWTTSIASDLGVPRVSFHALGIFPVAVMTSLFVNLPHLSVADDSTPFLVPDLPHPIHLVRPELPDFMRRDTHLAAAMDVVRKAEAGSIGVVVNSFSEMEADYAEYYYRIGKIRTWFVGPVALAACGGEDDQAARGGATGADGNRPRCLEWLDLKAAGSVVYVCFGSWSQFSGEQLREMAAGLEKSGQPFLWVVREGGELPERFEERLERRGMVVRGWSPQVAVLGHTAVGGFVTHCGWNSVLEGVSAGLPMATWPLSTEQFINEKLVVDVLRVGVKVCGGFRSMEEEEKVVVGAEEIGMAVGRIMGDGEEAEGMRRRAREYGEMARAAVKAGGSSYEDLSSLIEEIRNWNKDEGKDA